MDNRMISKRPRPHLHRTANLPRHWVVLPRPVTRAALRQPLLRGLCPTHVGYFPGARDHQVERAQGTLQTIFQYCAEGRGYAEVGGQRFAVEAGDLLVLPPNVAHAYGADALEPWSVFWFHAQGEQLEHLQHELGVSLAEPVAHVGKDPGLVALFEELSRVLEDDYSPPRLLYASRLLGHLLGLLVERRRENAPSSARSAEWRVRATLEYLKANLAQAPRVASLAAMAELSPSQYAALFKRLTGASAKDYSTRLRLHRAAQLLCKTELSVERIATLLGYADPLYFSRAFRRVNGACPSDYRKRERERMPSPSDVD